MELVGMGFIVGIVFSIIMIGAGIVFSKKPENDVKIYVPIRDRNKKWLENIDDESLGAVIRAIIAVNKLDQSAKEYLKEVAERLENDNNSNA